MDIINTDHLEYLITQQTGLKLRSRQIAILQSTIVDRLRALDLEQFENYLDLLVSNNFAAAQEWERIIEPLTNNESYFFRDKGQIALLRDRILPELIEANQATRKLRIWSAGCSTGEEAFTLAFLVDDLLHQTKDASNEQWEVSILGTDIDQSALDIARRGIFGAWSFRMVDPAIRRKYFSRHADDWLVSPVIRSLVKFLPCNLASDSFPGIRGMADGMDLILCRNVFIYFEPKVISRVLIKFSQSLREGGYLMTGHVETVGQVSESLKTIRYPESEIYQRSNVQAKSGADDYSGSEVAVVPNHPLIKKSEMSLPSDVSKWGNSPVLTQFELTSTRDDSHSTSNVKGQDTSSTDSSLFKQALALADQGQYTQAISSCQQIIEKYPFDSAVYELLASIAQDQGRHDDAKLLFKKALYLSPTSPNIYVELGALYSSEGDTVRAKKMNETALELLRHIHADEAPGYPYGPTAKELRLHLEEMQVREV